MQQCAANQIWELETLNQSNAGSKPSKLWCCELEPWKLWLIRTLLVHILVVVCHS